MAKPAPLAPYCPQGCIALERIPRINSQLIHPPSPWSDLSSRFICALSSIHLENHNVNNDYDDGSIMKGNQQKR
jgi:hypothetical protein